MKPFLSASLAGIALLHAPALFAQPAAPAQAPIKLIPGLATANVQEIVAASKAMINAQQERQVIYKNQYAMAEARRRQINAEIQPLMAKFNRDRQAGSVAQADLQGQARAIQNLQQAGVQELQTMLAPITLSETYVREQIGDVINRAITAAMAKRGVTFVVPPQNALAFNNGYNLNTAVVTELDAILPRASVAPPAGWRPKAERDAAAAQAAQLAKPGPGAR